MASQIPFPGPVGDVMFIDDQLDLSMLFHRLNNQLGIILANAELLEAKLHEDSARTRAGQVVSSAVEAIAAAREIRTRTRAGSE
jgi:hypothetical protein